MKKTTTLLLCLVLAVPVLGAKPTFQQRMAMVKKLLQQAAAASKLPDTKRTIVEVNGLLDRGQYAPAGKKVQSVMTRAAIGGDSATAVMKLNDAQREIDHLPSDARRVARKGGKKTGTVRR
jgi:hypothetical protein